MTASKSMPMYFMISGTAARAPPPTATTRSACWAKSSGATACGREKAGLSGPA